MDRKNVVRIGTRGSELALAQTDRLIAEFRRAFPQVRTEKVILNTKGDRILNQSLIDFGGKGVFVTEFEEALLNGDIDLAVHSAKDMPMELSEGLEIAGVLPRADVRDVLVIKKGIFPFKEDLIVGTGSLRRQLQLKALYPKVKCVSIRGNVPTRLRKIRDGECDGVILAAAGLERLGLLREPDWDYHYFSCEEMVPAGGQGIIAVEGRVGDEITKQIHRISDKKAAMELEMERKILKLLEAGCHEAVGVVSKVLESQIELLLVRDKNGIVKSVRGKSEYGNRMKLAEELVDRLSEGK